ncbi:MAG: hypothetical protein A3B37_00785 [Candidatus Sungbacteria bacterium RIFCSPLOWO2_01_FULL_59_16]|uniref:PKD domain-containing protein n=1 Tax=Candidatus Sungbacteria bacterium RIFCSPLOWO2_01_FULL_59_16 TaxID=1802280 RepID=A0A1G2LD13_9BACT|nr:MAG: hypothetical protein A3B37_00785 [Candidatus Sungbacteria bacterium RIFCSPLOWO2_01_FULL_59_16]
MRRSPFLLAFAIFIPAVMPLAASAAVVINEILFDPAGADTGLESIELYNPDAAAQDLSGWELYPDGIGYFIFPNGFSLSPGSFVAIHLRASGTNDAANLYHSSPTSNMGNSSGSLALFRPGGRGAETIVDFVRYHNAAKDPPAAERKTWESAAVEAGLWVAGELVDVGALAEGSSIGLSQDGARAGAASWSIFSAPTIGVGNASAPVPPPGGGAPPPASSTSTPIADSGRTPPPSLRVEARLPGGQAGDDRAVLAGAITEFRGQVFGLDGTLIENARMLWNFGDGSTREGKAVSHIYRFPGIYIVSLAGSSGEYAGSDYAALRVVAPEVSISEVMPGGEGFIELYNATGERLDLGGMSVTDGGGKAFSIPVGTLIERKTALVFSNALTGLSLAPPLTLRDAAGRTLDEARFSGGLPAGASWSRLAEGGFAAAAKPDPGTFISLMPPAVRPPAPQSLAQALPHIRSAGPNAAETGETPAADGIPPEPPPPPAPAASSRPEGRSGLSALLFGNVFLAGSIVLGAFAAAAFLVLKRKFSSAGSTERW